LDLALGRGAGGAQRQRDRAGAGGSVLDRPERGRHGAVAEQPLAGAEHDRDHQQAVLVDEVVPVQRLDQLRAAVHLQLAAGLVLERPTASRTSPSSTEEFAHPGERSVREAMC
jgi:hypothetical protein